MVLRVDGRQGPNNNEYPSHIKFIVISFLKVKSMFVLVNGGKIFK
jgi:hypothetical protein